MRTPLTNAMASQEGPDRNYQTTDEGPAMRLRRTSTARCLIPASSGKTLLRFATGFSKPNDLNLGSSAVRSAQLSCAGRGSLVPQLTTVYRS